MFESLVELYSGLNKQTLFACIAVVVSIFSLVLNIFDKRKRQHDSVIGALQGKKEAVAFIAAQLESDTWRRSRKQRLEMISALSNAWIFERSDRAKAMIYSALKKASRTESGKSEVLKTLDLVVDRLSVYATEVAPGEGDERIRRYQDRIDALKDGLNGT